MWFKNNSVIRSGYGALTIVATFVHGLHTNFWKHLIFSWPYLQLLRTVIKRNLYFTNLKLLSISSIMMFFFDTRLLDADKQGPSWTKYHVTTTIAKFFVYIFKIRLFVIAPFSTALNVRYYARSQSQSNLFSLETSMDSVQTNDSYKCKYICLYQFLFSIISESHYHSFENESDTWRGKY